MRDLFREMETRFQRKLIIAIAHDIGVLHRRRGLPPLYREAGTHFAWLAARTTGVRLLPTDASRWETAALIAYRGGYDRQPGVSPFKQEVMSLPRARRAREDAVHALPSTL